MRFRHYNQSGSLGNQYLFGLNVYKDHRSQATIDLIIGRHVFALLIGGRK
jgi:hypothetical protein